MHGENVLSHDEPEWLTIQMGGAALAANGLACRRLARVAQSYPKCAMQGKPRGLAGRLSRDAADEGRLSAA
ncbi:hypothetical protein D3C78_1515540 [compost metagenome]